MRKALQEKKALDEAQKDIHHLTKKEKLLFIAALYWAEGSKDDFGLSNTDPLLIKVFLQGLRDILRVADNQLSVSIRIYEDLDKDACLAFWSKIVKIPKDNFTHVSILQGKKTGKLPYGMCRIRVRKGGAYLKKIKATYLTVSERMSL